MKKTKLSLMLVSLLAASFASAYPLAFRYRPLTLPQGIAEINARLGLGSFQPEQFGLGLNAAVGLTDAFQIGLLYNGIAFKPFGFIQQISPHLSAGFVQNDSMAMAGRLSVPILFANPYVNTVMVDLPTRIFLGDYVDLNLFHMDFLTFEFGNAFNAQIQLPVTFGFQITDALWAYLGTRLAELNTNTTMGQRFLWQGFPFHLGLLYAFTESFDAVAMLDSGALTSVAQNMNFALGINFRFGNM